MQQKVPLTRHQWHFHFGSRNGERNPIQAAAAISNSFSNVLTESVKPACTAGVVLIVMCLRHQAHVSVASVDRQHPEPEIKTRATQYRSERLIDRNAAMTPELERASEEASRSFVEIYEKLETRKVDAGLDFESSIEVLRNTLKSEGVGLLDEEAVVTY